MAHNPTIAARVHSKTRDALFNRAANEGISPSALIERFVTAGLDLPPPPEPADGPVVAAVAALFAELATVEVDLALRRELAMLLARTAERETGPAQVGAVRELLAVARGAAGAAEDAWAAFSTRLGTPVQTTADDSPNGSGPSKEQP